MLKRFSSLILALMLGGSVLAGTARLHDEHVCKMAGVELMSAGIKTMPGMETMAGMDETMPDMENMPGMEMMPGMETMPCCQKDEAESAVSESGLAGDCCVTIPQEPGSTGTTFNLRSPSFSIAVIHPAVVQSPLPTPKPYECSYSTEAFLPNLQASYIRNLSLLI